MLCFIGDYREIVSNWEYYGTRTIVNWCIVKILNYVLVFDAQSFEFAMFEGKLLSFNKINEVIFNILMKLVL